MLEKLKAEYAEIQRSSEGEVPAPTSNYQRSSDEAIVLFSRPGKFAMEERANNRGS